MTASKNGGLAIEDINLENDPKYKAVYDKLTELRLDLAAANREIDDLRFQLTQAPEEHRSTVLTEARKRITAGAVLPELTAATVREQLNTVLQERSVLDEAIRLQSQLEATVRLQVSGRIAQLVAPAHRAIVRRQAEALVSVARENEREAQLRDDLTAKNISYSAHIRPMNITLVGLLRDSHSNVRRYLRECVEFGFLTAKEVDRLCEGGTL